MPPLARSIRRVGFGALAALGLFTAALGLPFGAVAAPLLLGIINTPPVATPDAYSTAFQTELNVDAPGILGNDLDLDGDRLRPNLVSGTAHGDLNLENDGRVRYRPDAGFSGVDTFTYRASDDQSNSLPTVVTITVRLRPQPTPSPTPKPTPKPTPAPTPTPTPTPIPTLPVPTVPVPTLPVPTVPAPTLPVGTSTPTPNVDPTPSPSRSPSPSGPTPAGSSPTSSPGAASSAAGGPSPSAPVGAAPIVAGVPPSDAPALIVPLPDPGPVEIRSGVLGPGVDWVVPTVVLTVPGLLLIVIALTQLAGGLIWLPVVRRWLRGDGRRSPASNRG
ncbi:MAG: Ig-like domain-containing protein [Chloroflexota bacterium]